MMERLRLERRNDEVVGMKKWTQNRDLLREKYGSEEALNKAKELLQRDEQTEEAFLGAQGVLLLQGII